MEKSLKFLKQSERKLLIESIKKEKQSFLNNVQLCSANEYTGYLKHLPVKKSVFLSANNCLLENGGVSENLFDTLINIFNSVKKRRIKVQQMACTLY